MNIEAELIIKVGVKQESALSIGISEVLSWACQWMIVTLLPSKYRDIQGDNTPI